MQGSNIVTRRETEGGKERRTIEVEDEGERKRQGVVKGGSERGERGQREHE